MNYILVRWCYLLYSSVTRDGYICYATVTVMRGSTRDRIVVPADMSLNSLQVKIELKLH